MSPRPTPVLALQSTFLTGALLARPRRAVHGSREPLRAAKAAHAAKAARAANVAKAVART
ncbi:hypothetical protein GCM10023086_47310 [Streptomyces venetus]|uniref:Uncharacterized protein n=1 Tax=Streptomyces venetus TaxID=1701086 RepID=A0ABP8GDS4_9ACTN